MGKVNWDDVDKYWVNNGPRTVFIVIWVLANVVLFLERFIFYLNSPVFGVLNHGVTFARAAAAALKLDCVLLLVTVLRNTLSWIRGSRIGDYVPVDQNIEFHKGIAWTVAFFSVIHVVAHYFNFRSISMATAGQLGAIGLSPIDPWALGFTSLPGVSGHVLVLCMVLMYSSAIPRIRGPRFEVFWYTHHLFVVFFALLCIHGAAGLLEPPTFWIWFIGPGFLYLVERILRVFRGHADTILKAAIIHPSRVIELQMQKTTFNYKPGQYVFIACPHIAAHEWHPFTITSCPEEDFVSVHIRIVGDWTTALFEFMNPKNRLGLVLENVVSDEDGRPILKIDGPFGTASEEVFRSETVMLIGAGIGVTPFASILKSCRYAIERQLTGVGVTPIKKVYFYWISRDRNAFEWFSDLLGALEKENLNNFLEIHTYLTGGLRPDEIRNVMYGGDEEADQITGLETRTTFGRPKWEQIFSDHTRIHSGEEIGVFFCGPAVLSKQLYANATKFTAETSTRFRYRKENF